MYTDVYECGGGLLLVVGQGVEALCISERDLLAPATLQQLELFACQQLAAAAAGCCWGHSAAGVGVASAPAHAQCPPVPRPWRPRAPTPPPQRHLCCPPPPPPPPPPAPYGVVGSPARPVQQQQPPSVLATKHDFSSAVRRLAAFLGPDSPPIHEPDLRALLQQPRLLEPPPTSSHVRR
ncbi:WAS/WASL-interacting protein family member 3-like [Schistocerca americana]|uniref:WAS/WASL-interacting protein family member 3-like n=1 Tax=Schistocerca americana TaxID=7009 RepID=UPI001F4FDC50|nr:WAS/WASL-interacting protein family member 3-like [Schistocerca americana]